MKTSLPVVVLTAPPLAAFALVAVFLTAEAMGLRPFDAEPANLSEAAATGSAAAALRFIRAGANPNAPQTIAPGVLGSLPRTVNAIDAAILGRREEMITLLLKHGASETDAARVRCLAGAVDFPEALKILGVPGEADPESGPEVDDPIAPCLQDGRTD